MIFQKKLKEDMALWAEPWFESNPWVVMLQEKRAHTTTLTLWRWNFFKLNHLVVCVMVAHNGYFGHHVKNRLSKNTHVQKDPEAINTKFYGISHKTIL